MGTVFVTVNDTAVTGQSTCFKFPVKRKFTGNLLVIVTKLLQRFTIQNLERVQRVCHSNL
jgi:hypothetical protein